MLDWVRALLDPSDIVQSPASAKKHISPPPKFEMQPLDPAALLPPPPTTGRGRARRSASPSKIASPKKGTGAPRKARQTRAQKEASAASANAASASLQSALDTAASTADSEEKNEEPSTANGEHSEETANGVQNGDVEEEEAKLSTDKVKVDVQTTVDLADKTEKTDVSVEMPVGLPELPLPEDTEQMIAKAKEMVAEATKLQEAETSAAGTSASSPKESKKRKTDESVEDGESADATDTPAQPAKKAKVLEDRLRRERVRNRALVGVTATLALA